MAPWNGRAYGGRRIKIENYPNKFRFTRTPKKLGSIFGHGLYVVQEPLRNLIEELDPGRQQFWPFTVTMPRDIPYPVPCYGMNIVPECDTIIVERSNMIVNSENWFDFKPDFNRPNGKKFSAVFDRSKRDGAHIWREKRIHMDMFISDELKDQIEARGLLFFPGCEYVAEV